MLTPSPLDDRNKAKRVVVEANHNLAQQIQIDIDARSQEIKLGATALSFRTPCRVIVSGPTLRKEKLISCFYA